MSRPKKRSFSIKGHRTSLSLEQPFWQAMREVAAKQNIALATMVTRIDATRGDTGLSTAVRIHLLEHYMNLADPDPGDSRDGPSHDTTGTRPVPQQAVKKSDCE